MSRYKNLTKSKREFLEDLLHLDLYENYNILDGDVYREFKKILNEKRYLTKDSEWINKQINLIKNEYVKAKTKEILKEKRKNE